MFQGFERFMIVWSDEGLRISDQEPVYIHSHSVFWVVRFITSFLLTISLFICCWSFRIYSEVIGLGIAAFSSIFRAITSNLALVESFMPFSALTVEFSRLFRLPWFSTATIFISPVYSSITMPYCWHLLPPFTF